MQSIVANTAQRSCNFSGWPSRNRKRIKSDGQIVLTIPSLPLDADRKRVGVNQEQLRPAHAPPNERQYQSLLLGIWATGDSRCGQRSGTR